VISLSNRFQAPADLDDGSVEKELDRVRIALTTSCDEVVGFRERGFQTLLLEESIKKIEESRVVHQNVWQTKTTAHIQNVFVRNITKRTRPFERAQGETNVNLLTDCRRMLSKEEQGSSNERRDRQT